MRLGPAGLELMRGLAADRSAARPAHRVAPAVAELPPAVTAGSGFVGAALPGARGARCCARRRCPSPRRARNRFAT